MSLMVGTVVSFGAMREKPNPVDLWFVLGSVTVADWVVDIVRYSQRGMVLGMVRSMVMIDARRFRVHMQFEQNGIYECED